jgi:hypothetical protein
VVCGSQSTHVGMAAVGEARWRRGSGGGGQRPCVVHVAAWAQSAGQSCCVSPSARRPAGEGHSAASCAKRTCAAVSARHASYAGRTVAYPRQQGGGGRRERGRGRPLCVRMASAAACCASPSTRPADRCCPRRRRRRTRRRFAGGAAPSAASSFLSLSLPLLLVVVVVWVLAWGAGATWP